MSEDILIGALALLPAPLPEERAGLAGGLPLALPLPFEFPLALLLPLPLTGAGSSKSSSRLSSSSSSGSESSLSSGYSLLLHHPLYLHFRLEGLQPQD